ncbi:MAG: DNA recombination protein RmuC [Bacteroidia bacterium]|nr:DNA recombination protein RmuC [Bacteroidia bacterium]
MDILYTLIGLVIGGGISLIALRSKLSQKNKITEEQQLLIIEKDKQLEVLKTKLENLSNELSKISSSKNEEIIRLETVYKSQLELAQKNAKEEQQRVENIAGKLASTEQIKNNQAAKINELQNEIEKNTAIQLKEIETLNQKLTDQFKNIANEVLAEKSKTFTEQNKNNLDLVLTPLKEKIDLFQNKVENTFKTDTADRVLLKEQIDNLAKLNQSVSAEAGNLAKALKGDNKTQGNWGEMLLEKILERSGLRKNHEYGVQQQTQNNEEKNIKPDVIIYLPDSKHLIIDSKVSLLAFEAYMNTEDEDQKNKFQKEHIQSLRNHIKGLSDKNYQTATGLNTPDMVLLFIPIEPSFSLALQADPEIYSYAWERKIVLVSPTTLLATLRTIASIWKQENQVKYAREIAKMAGDLYDKFAGFSDDLIKIGDRLKQTQDAYNDSLDKLSRGKGNLINRVTKLKEYGIRNTKELSDKLPSADE